MPLNRESYIKMSSTNTGFILKWFRWLFRCCLDCGTKLDKHYNRGDVCWKCFDEFEGLTTEELIN